LRSSPVGRAASKANASFVGAKTVIGPGPDKASTRLAFPNNPTNVDKSAVSEAVSTIDLPAGAGGLGATVVVSPPHPDKLTAANTVVTTAKIALMDDDKPKYRRRRRILKDHVQTKLCVEPACIMT